MEEVLGHEKPLSTTGFSHFRLSFPSCPIFFLKLSTFVQYISPNLLLFQSNSNGEKKYIDRVLVREFITTFLNLVFNHFVPGNERLSNIG